MIIQRRKALLRLARRDKLIKNSLFLSKGVYYINEDKLALKNIVFNVTTKDEGVQKFAGVLRKSLQPIEIKVRNWWSRRGNK